MKVLPRNSLAYALNQLCEQLQYKAESSSTRRLDWELFGHDDVPRKLQSAIYELLSNAQQAKLLPDIQARIVNTVLSDTWQQVTAFWLYRQVYQLVHQELNTQTYADFVAENKREIAVFVRYFGTHTQQYSTLYRESLRPVTMLV